MESQAKFFLYFGAQMGSGQEAVTSKITRCEHARCILQSWTVVYKAIVLGSMECMKVDTEGTWILEGLFALRDSAVATEELSNFILEAATDGVILEKDAEELI